MEISQLKNQLYAILKDCYRTHQRYDEHSPAIDRIVKFLELMGVKPELDSRPMVVRPVMMAPVVVPTPEPVEEGPQDDEPQDDEPTEEDK